MYDAVHRYQIDKAAGGTDPDRARALSQTDPSLFWLAVEIIAAGLGAATAAQTFRGLAQIRRAALATRAPDELAGRLDEMRLLTEGSGLPDDVAERLGQQVLDEHPAPTVSGRAKSAQKIEIEAASWPNKPGDPAYATFGPASASHPAEFAGFMAKAEQIGAQIVERPGALAYQPSSVAGKPGISTSIRTPR